MSDGCHRSLPNDLLPEFDPPDEESREAWPKRLRAYVEHLEELVANEREGCAKIADKCSAICSTCRTAKVIAALIRDRS